MPVQKGRNAIGFTMNGSYISGFGGLVAPPFQRFYMGGDNDVRGFDIRSISPVAFLPSSSVITLTNPDGSPVPKNPANPRLGNWTVPIPVDQIVFPGGDLLWCLSTASRLRTCDPAPFVDAGIDPIIRRSVADCAGAIRSGSLHTFRLPATGYQFQLRRRQSIEPAAVAISVRAERYELASAHVNRTGVADVPAGDQCPLPHLLGI